MPQEWRERLHAVGIDKLTTENLLESDVEFEAGFLELICKDKKTAKQYANWIVNIEIPLRREMIEKSENLEVNNENREKIFIGVNNLVEGNKINSNNAKNIIVELLSEKLLPDSLEDYANTKGYIQMSDSGEMEAIVQKVIDDNPKPVEDVKNGEMKAIGFLVGQVMKASQGKANPAEAQKIIRKLLEL